MSSSEGASRYTVRSFLGSAFAFLVVTIFSVAGAIDGRNGSRGVFIVTAVLAVGLTLTCLAAALKMRRMQSGHATE